MFINMESIPKGRNDCQILLTMTVNLQVMNDNRTIIRDLDSDYHTYSVVTRTIIRDLGSDYHTYTVLTRTIIRDLGSDYHTYSVLTRTIIRNGSRQRLSYVYRIN